MLQFYKLNNAGTAEKDMESVLDFLPCSNRPVDRLFRLMCLVALRHPKPPSNRIHHYKSPPSLQKKKTHGRSGLLCSRRRTITANIYS